MKKSIKVIAIILGVIILVVAGIGGKMYMDEKKTQDEMIAVVKENKQVVEDELKIYDKNGKIKSITINYDSVKKSPMGGLLFEGYVNGNKELTFNAGLQKYNSKIEATNIGLRRELNEYLEKK